MKKLQNNFTMPEQSKRLLELGVPADSADCYYDKYRILPELLFNGDTMQDLLDANEPQDPNEYLPCWSVGRLIEIFELCSGVLWQDTARPSVKQPNLIERVIDTIVLFNKHGNMDFSKLED